jgi:hypothetical protein
LTDEQYGMCTREDGVTAKSPSWWVRLRHSIRALMPYAAIVLILPGGGVIPLAVWVWRHRSWLAARARRGLTALVALAVGLIFPR